MREDEQDGRTGVVAPSTAGAGDLERAVELHRQGNDGDAWALYERVLTKVPEDPTALHYAGLLAWTHGERELGIAMIRRALGHAPDYVDAHNNLGNVFKVDNRLGEADACYRRALELDPDAIDPTINLGVLARARGEFDVAERHYRRALELSPENPLVFLNLSGLLERQGRTHEALDMLQSAIAGTVREDVSQRPLLLRRANILRVLGRESETRVIYERLLESNPDDELACHMLAALTGENVPARPDERYVRNLFDSFSQSFDEVLDNLDYRAPELVGAVVARLYGAGTGSLRVLDAGCGTGLCGQYLRAVSGTLDGVDLSSGMLARAAVSGHYDRLVEAEITAFLRQVDAPFDLIVSADTFCYFGALDELFGVAAAALAPGGHLVFTVEREDGPAPAGFLLNPHGRYGHTRDGVSAELRGAGLSVGGIDEVVLRRERGEPVHGFLVTAHAAGDARDRAPARVH